MRKARTTYIPGMTTNFPGSIKRAMSAASRNETVQTAQARA
jgi:hypothetical protein